MGNGQTIRCTVESCKYYGKGGYCRLESIEVAPQHNVYSGIAEEETLCSSYEPILEL
ncbi:MAG: DUF1540 domain-containing protein [Syntrophomonadaceae bacterium]|jgi:hypothetical protein|nr:DUF1540 domain-containing protein [Syntrophomonadaceae bacterium]